MSDDELSDAGSEYSGEESGGEQDNSWISTGAPLKLASEPPMLNGKPLLWAGPREPRFINLDEQDTKEEKARHRKDNGGRAERRFKDKEGIYYVMRRFPVGHDHLQVKRKVYDDPQKAPYPKPITGINKIGERHRTQPYLYYSSGKNPALLLVNPEKKLQVEGLVMDVCEDLAKEDADPDQAPNNLGEVPKPKPEKILADPWDQRRLVLKYMADLKSGKRTAFVPYNCKDWAKAKAAQKKIQDREEKQEQEWKEYQKNFRSRTDAKAKEAKEKAAAAKKASNKAKKKKKPKGKKKKAGGGVNNMSESGSD